MTLFHPFSSPYPSFLTRPGHSLNRSFLPLLITLILFSLLPATSLAQLRDLEIKPEEPPDRGIPVFRHFPDQAAVIIFSSLTNLQISSNMGIVEDLSRPEDGRYILLIGAYRQIFTVRAQGFREARIQIPNMNAREVAYFSVEPREPEPVTGRGSLILGSLPEGARITVDGIPDFKQKTPYTFADWAAQSYRILLELDRHEPKELMVTIPEGRLLSRTVELTPKFGYVVISELGNLRIRYEGEETFSRVSYEPNHRLELPRGRHELELSRDYYTSFNEELEISSGETINWSVEMEPTHGFLSINHDGEVRYREKGQRTWSRSAYRANETMALPEGHYELELHRSFYDTESKDVTIELGREVYWQASSRPLYGILRVHAGIPVEIEVEDNLAPDAPPGSNYVNIETGRKRVMVSAPEYISETFYVSVPAGGVLDTTLTLTSLSESEELEQRRELPRGAIMAAADLDDTEIWINGEMAGHGEVSQTVITGDYTVEFRHRSKRKSKTVSVPPAGVEQIFTEFRPVKGRAVALGLLMPGAGHIYTDRSRGYLYGVAFLGAAAGTYAMWSHYQDLENRYELAMERYEAAYADYLDADGFESTTDAKDRMLNLFGDAENLHNDRSRAYSLSGYLIAGAATIYMANLIDLLLTQPSQGYRTGRLPEGFSASIQPRGKHDSRAVLTYQYRF